jgi:hypothetical protein
MRRPGNTDDNKKVLYYHAFAGKQEISPHSEGTIREMRVMNFVIKG